MRHGEALAHSREQSLRSCKRHREQERHQADQRKLRATCGGRRRRRFHQTLGSADRRIHLRWQRSDPLHVRLCLRLIDLREVLARRQLLHRCDKTISAPRDSDDVVVFGEPFIERLAQRRDMAGEVVFFNHGVGPHRA
jgi:hypothetical protein